MSTPIERFNELSKTTGVGRYQASGYTGEYTNTKKPARSSGFDFKNLGQSLARIPGQAVGAVASSVAKGFTDVAGGIVENLPGLGTNQIAQKGFEDRRQLLDQHGDFLQKAYAGKKITKEEFKRRNQQLIAEYQGLSGEIGGHVKQMTTPEDYLTGLATVGSLPLAAGRLTAAGRLGKAGVATERALMAAKTGQSTLAAAGKALIKYPLVTQPTAQAPIEIAKNLKEGKNGEAALNAALLASPLGIAGAGKAISKIGPRLSLAAFGKSAVLADAFGRGRVEAYLKANPSKAPILKMMEQFTLNQTAVEGDVAKGGKFLADHLKSRGVDVEKATMDQIVKQFIAYATNDKKLAIKKIRGVAPENAVVSADFRDAIPKVVERLKSLEDADGPTRVKAANEALDELGIKNQTVRDQIGAALLQGASAEELKPIVQKVIIPGVELDKGFIATFGPAKSAVVPSLGEAITAGAPELGSAPKGIIGAVAGGLEKAGLGLKDFDTSQIGQARQSFIKTIENKIPGRDGKEIYERLDKLSDAKRVSDLRQLGAFGTGEIEQALDVSAADARKVIKALNSMYDNVDLKTRGLSGKLQDKNLKINPLARPYSRIQSALRYTYNPAFKAQQRVEAATLSQIVTGGHKVGGDVSKTIKLMRDKEFLPGRDSSYAGEAIRETAGETKITSNLLPGEERSLAHTLEAIADKNGRTVEQELDNPKTREMLRMIVQNPKQGLLSSNLAKGLNLALFPATYNLKVTTLAVKALASQPPAVQFGVLKSISDFNDYLKSDEGIKWQRDNSELLGLIQYFTPINSVQQTIGFLGTGDVRKLGLVGGLPFGVISRVLEGQGKLPKSNPPYLDPKTGEIVPDKIPETAKARLQTAAIDIIDTMFTYPGRQAGLGSKKDLINTVTGGVLKTGPGETRSVTREGELTPADRNKQRVLSPPAKASQTTPQLSRSVNVNLPAPKVQPKTGSIMKPPKKKTLAKRPGQSF